MKPGMKYSMFTALTMLLLAGYKTHLGAMDETSLEDLIRSLLEVK